MRASHDSLCVLPSDPLFVGEPLNVATFNAYGLPCVPDKSSVGKTRGQTRLQHLIHAMDSSQLDIVGVQEPIFRVPPQNPCSTASKPCDYHKARSQLADAGFFSISNLSPQGRGGVALIFSQRWTVMSPESLEPRVLFARLKHDTGQLLQVLVAHCHHEGRAREQMWRDLPLLLWDARIPVLTLCDNNSVLAPGNDPEKTSARDSGRCVVDA
jgi:endonuclease/exonuclease/phosphatase family metal-dependent hydrolase